MPEFIHDKKVYYHPVEFLMDRIGGTWKMPILWRLKDKVLRYSELRKKIPHITDNMLSITLKQLEAFGFIKRKAYPEVPPRVEYSITDKGLTVIPVIKTLIDYGLDLMEQEGIEHKRV
jgi:DNA-binding HxlR family transcriptional regulator